VPKIFKKILHHRHKSPGSRNRSIYIRRHISTSGNAHFVDERAQLEFMENSFLRENNKPRIRKSNYFSTETLISGHRCSNRRSSSYVSWRTWYT